METSINALFYPVSRTDWVLTDYRVWRHKHMSVYLSTSEPLLFQRVLLKTKDKSAGIFHRKWRRLPPPPLLLVFSIILLGKTFYITDWRENLDTIMQHQCLARRTGAFWFSRAFILSSGFILHKVSLKLEKQISRCYEFFFPILICFITIISLSFEYFSLQQEDLSPYKESYLIKRPVGGICPCPRSGCTLASYKGEKKIHNNISAALIIKHH